MSTTAMPDGVRTIVQQDDTDSTGPVPVVIPQQRTRALPYDRRGDLLRLALGPVPQGRRVVGRDTGR